MERGFPAKVLFVGLRSRNGVRGGGLYLYLRGDNCLSACAVYRDRCCGSTVCRVSNRVFRVLLLPCVPTAEKYLKFIVAKTVLRVKLLRHTGAFIFGRSLAVRYNRLVLGQLGYASVHVGLRERYGPSYVALVVGFFGTHVNNERAFRRVVVKLLEVCERHAGRRLFGRRVRVYGRRRGIYYSSSYGWRVHGNRSSGSRRW